MKLIKLILITSISCLIGCGSNLSDRLNENDANSDNQKGGYFMAGEPLPYFGPITFQGSDTLFYQIPKFSLIDQDSLDLGYSSFENRIMIVDFFFTTCSTICPIMTGGLVKLQNDIAENGMGEAVNFLSVTIDPEIDNPSTLKAYAIEKGVNFNNWKFATADLDYIDRLSKEGFFLALDRDAAYQDGIIHSSQVILVDQNRHVRGSYDAIDENELKLLLEDLILLSDEK